MLASSKKCNTALLRAVAIALVLAVLLLSIAAVAHFHPDQSRQNNDHCSLCMQIAGFVVACVMYLILSVCILQQSRLPGHPQRLFLMRFAGRTNGIRPPPVVYSGN
jgi:hypothetical protein